jgi:malate dehydrogenase
MAKVTIFGAGNVGATCAHVLAQRDICDVTMIDVVEGMPQGKALDMRQSGPLQDFGVEIAGSNDYAAVNGSDVVVVTAGLARKPGMDRMELLQKNVTIVAGAAKAIREHAPNSIIVMVTNPLDVMAFVAMKVSGFPRERVVGMAATATRWSRCRGSRRSAACRSPSSWTRRPSRASPTARARAARRSSTC